MLNLFQHPCHPVSSVLAAFSLRANIEAWTLKQVQGDSCALYLTLDALMMPLGRRNHMSPQNSTLDRPVFAFPSSAPQMSEPQVRPRLAQRVSAIRRA
jgi:hypothetical protein